MSHNLLMSGILFKASCPRQHPAELKFSYNVHTYYLKRLFKELLVCLL